MFDYSRSEALYERALHLIPGGVNSPVRAFRSVGRSPVFVSRGEGSHIYDVDGNRYIDYVMSYGPLLFGHAPQPIIDVIIKAAVKGTSFGATTEAEVDFAEKLVAFVPSLQKVRLVNSGTEAVMSAVRAARGFTKRDKVIKFEGNYHGHSDGLLSNAGSGLATYDLPGSAGVPVNLTRDTITVPFNSPDLLKAALQAHEGEVACILVEPVPANMGVVRPLPGFLELLRDEATRRHIVLIFDEVITGFRLARGGAQELFGVTPDLTCLGKIAGGGLPLAAYGGRGEIMDSIAPVGAVYQAGTLSGNPLAVAAGLEVLRQIEQHHDLYVKLEAKMQWLAHAAEESAARHKVPVTVNTIGSLMTIFFTPDPVRNYVDARRSDTAQYARFFGSVLENGLAIAPSQFEAAFVSTAHTSDDLETTAAIVDIAFKALGA